LEPEDIHILSLGAIWNFSKGTGLYWADIRSWGTKGQSIRSSCIGTVWAGTQRKSVCLYHLLSSVLTNLGRLDAEDEGAMGLQSVRLLLPSDTLSHGTAPGSYFWTRYLYGSFLIVRHTRRAMMLMYENVNRTLVYLNIAFVW